MFLFNVVTSKLQVKFLASSPCFLRHKKTTSPSTPFLTSPSKLQHLWTKVLPTNWPWHGDNFRIEDFPLLPKKLTPYHQGQPNLIDFCCQRVIDVEMSIRFLLRPCSENLPSTWPYSLLEYQIILLHHDIDISPTPPPQKKKKNVEKKPESRAFLILTTVWDTGSLTITWPAIFGQSKRCGS